MEIYRRDGVVIREARVVDIQALKDRLREADIKEVIAAGNENAESALKNSFTRSSLRYCVDIDGAPAAMFGIVPDRGGTILGGSVSGNVWFLGTAEMSKIKKTFVKLSRRIIASFLAEWPLLWNCVDARYICSVAWLRSCGAIFGPDFEINGVDFIPFVFRRT